MRRLPSARHFAGLQAAVRPTLQQRLTQHALNHRCSDELVAERRDQKPVAVERSCSPIQPSGQVNERLYRGSTTDDSVCRAKKWRVSALNAESTDSSSAEGGCAPRRSSAARASSPCDVARAPTIRSFAEYRLATPTARASADMLRLVNAMAPDSAKAHDQIRTQTCAELLLKSGCLPRRHVGALGKVDDADRLRRRRAQFLGPQGPNREAIRRFTARDG